MKPFIKSLTILTTSVLLVCCSKNPETRIKYYGVISEENKNRIVKIDPVMYSTFDDLVNKIEEVVCDDSIPTISFYDKNVEYLIGLANPCWEGIRCIFIAFNDILKIQDERIELDETVSSDSLEEYISIHYNNHGKHYFFSDSPQKARISITYKNLPILAIKPVLLRIIKTFENLNIESPLRLTMDRQIPPPPPPPPFTDFGDYDGIDDL